MIKRKITGALKHLRFAIVFFLILLSIFPVYNPCFTPTTKITESVPLFAASIQIYGNAQLNFTASSGNGTQLNPYVIENLTINGMGSPCIWISTTTAFFILQYNLLFNGTGIQLDNVKNGIMRNNTFNATGWGIDVSESENILIYENNLTENQRGIHIQGSNDTIISHNNVTSSTDQSKGIHIDGGNNVTLLNNHIYTRTWGVSFSEGIGAILNNVIVSQGTSLDLYKTNNSIISNNTILNGDEGVYLAGCNNNTFFNNTVAQNGYGIYMTDQYGLSNENRFITNNISNNVRGIYMLLANATTVDGNQINHNRYQGLYMQNSNYTTITNNQFLDNGWGYIWEGSTIYEGPNCYFTVYENNTIVDKWSFLGGQGGAEWWWGLLIGGIVLGCVVIYFYVKRKRSP